MLIKLVSIHPCPSPQSIPLAGAFLKAYAHGCSVSIDLVDFFLVDSAATCAAKLVESLPTAVGFSVYVWNYTLICEIASELKRAFPTIKLFCGGPEVTASTESVLKRGIFDFVIVGEGEVPFLSLCQSLSGGGEYSDIPGILLPGSTLVPAPPPLKDLDVIPSPYLTGVIDTHISTGILWQLSRGCSFTCDFCFDSRGIHGVRHFSLNRLEAELLHFAASAVTQVFVLDSTFNLDKVRAKNILRMIRKSAPDIHFHFEVRSEFIDRDMAALFAQIACSLQIGLQSADREVLKLVGRSFNKADFTAKIGLLNESGAVFGFDLIYGLPGDTLNGFCHTLDYALSLYPNHLDIFPLSILPGTRLASRGAVLGMQWDANPPYILESTDTFSPGDMAAAADLATACDIFYTRGKAVAWFNAIIHALGMKPSAVLQNFSQWLITHRGRTVKETDFSDDEIWELQQNFLKHLFKPNSVRRFLPLVLDLVTYHHHYAEVLLAPLSPHAVTGSARLTVAPSARLVGFTYDIEELLEYGEPQIPWMFENIRQSGSHVVIYRNDGMVCTESLANEYVLLLKHIQDGNVMPPETGTGLTVDEANEFIVFALLEGIIVTT